MFIDFVSWSPGLGTKTIYSKTCQSRNLSMPETSQSRTFFDTSQFFHTFWPVKDGKSSDPEAGIYFWNEQNFLEHFDLWKPENVFTWTGFKFYFVLLFSTVHSFQNKGWKFVFLYIFFQFSPIKFQNYDYLKSLKM